MEKRREKSVEFEP